MLVVGAGVGVGCGGGAKISLVPFSLLLGRPGRGQADTLDFNVDLMPSCFGSQYVLALWVFEGGGGDDRSRSQPRCKASRRV